MSSAPKNGSQIAAESLQRFQEWILERDRANDWADYWHADKLSRTDIARECGFGTAALRQNPRIKEGLEALEGRLRLRWMVEAGYGDAPGQNASIALPEASDNAVSCRLALAKSSADRRIKNLEEANASLRGEVTYLRAQLKNYAHIDEILSTTGRLVRP